MSAPDLALIVLAVLAGLVVIGLALGPVVGDILRTRREADTLPLDDGLIDTRIQAARDEARNQLDANRRHIDQLMAEIRQADEDGD